MSKPPVHGNYHGYYTKRPLVNDERLRVLPSNVFKDATVLDVGCNEGWKTCEIAQCYGAKSVVGVDIDDSLVQSAWRRRRTVWSTQGPVLAVETESAPPLLATNYFPASCEHEFGPLPIPPSEFRGKDSFPHNISFRTADWVNQSIPEDKAGYDVVLGFSITKWIHLNEGDDGLKAFFRRVFDVLKHGGRFVLEPQPWDSYAKAKRMNDKLKENYNKIKIKPEDFEKVLKDIGFRDIDHFGVVGAEGFQRPIELYVKP